MEQTMLWVTVFGIIVIPLAGWLVNTLITRKIDALEEGRKEDKNLFFDQLNGLRKSIEENYVLQKMYDQAMKFSEDKNDEKFKSLLVMMNTQFENVEGKIDDIKTLINEKFNNHKQGG